MTGGPLPLPDPPIRTPRLLLRAWQPDDADALVAAWADPEVRRWTGVPERPDRATAAAWIGRTPALRDAGRSLDLVIDVDGAVAGEVGVVVATDDERRSGEIGWWLAPDHRGRGLASEAVDAFTGWLLGPAGPDVAEVVARCATANPRAGRVAAAAGFHHEPASGDPEVELWRAGARPGAGTLHT